MSHVEEASRIINAIVSDSKAGDCWDIHMEILKQLDDPNLHDETKEYLKLAGNLATCSFDPKNTHEPYSAFIVTKDRRTFSPVDLNTEEVSELKELGRLLGRGSLSARIFDVVWLYGGRNIDDAREAIESYIETARTYLSAEDWIVSAEFAERAMRLGSLLRRKDPEPCEKVAALLSEWVNGRPDLVTSFLPARAILLLLSFGYGEPKQLGERASELARIAEETRDFHRAEEYWLLATEAFRDANTSTEADSSQESLAETYYQRAVTDNGSGLFVSHWLRRAIEAYKAVPNSRGRTEQIYKELSAQQANALNELGKFSHEIDISEIVVKTVASISGKTLLEAIFTLAFRLVAPPKYQQLKEHAIKLNRDHPLSGLFGSVRLNKAGKIVGGSPPSGGDPDVVSPHQLFQLAEFHHRLAVDAYIIPAIQVILAEHRVTQDDLVRIAVNNPFVATGQEILYAKALLAGLQHDYLIALPLLVPLTENSIRHVLEQSGVRVWTLNNHGVQEAMRLNALLDNPKTKEIFGEDIVQDLRGLLLERTYANLRNKVAHGLFDVGELQQSTSVYFWWLNLRLFLQPLFDYIVEDSNERSDGKDNQ